MRQAMDLEKQVEASMAYSPDSRSHMQMTAKFQHDQPPTPLISPTDSEPLGRLAWSRLNHLQVGRYGEYLVKLEFSVFGAEVDDRGIDMVVRTDSGNHYDVPVKSVRSLNYVFFRKRDFTPSPNLLAAIVLLTDGNPPDLYLVPSEVWLRPNALFVSNDYGEGKKSPPEWGINLSRRNLPLLEPCRFELTIVGL